MQISGSINVPAYAVRTKTYLRDARLLLLNGGGAGTELEPICHRLRDAGFATVGILDGGLAFWARHVGGLVGDPRAIRFLNRMTAAQFTPELPSGEWFVVDVSASDASAPPYLLPATRIPGRAGSQLRRDLTRALTDEGRDPARSFVMIVDQRGETYDQLEADLSALGITHLYFLRGGVDSYRNYQAQQRQMAAAPKRGCQTCGK